MDKRICIALICWGLLVCVAARTTSTSTASTSTTTARTMTTTTAKVNPYKAGGRNYYYNQPTIIEHFSHRNPDGSYEFRFELSDGNTRYERGYFVNRDNEPSLVVTGYYAYRLDDGRYTTVFYNADHNGYRQQASTTSQGWPDLPRRIEVPTDGVDEVAAMSSTLLPRRYVENVENELKDDASGV